MKYKKDDIVVIKDNPAYSSGPWRIIELIPSYGGFTPPELGYRMVDAFDPNDGLIIVVAEEVIDHIFTLEPGHIIQMVPGVDSATLRRNFEAITANVLRLNESLEVFKTLLEKMEGQG